MKAFILREYGSPQGSGIADIALPEPGPGAVLVRVIAAGINQMDWKVQDGSIRDFIPHRLPLTLGWELAGVVEAVGSDVTDWKSGDTVIAMADLIAGGAFADFVCVPAASIAPKPDTVGFAEAACIPLSSTTAFNCLFDFGRLVKGQKVLIHAAAGSVGLLAVQLAKQAGAHVTTTCSAGGIALVRSLGADRALDYASEDFASEGPFDLVLDAVGGEVRDRSWEVLNSGGRMATIVPPYDPTADQPRDDVEAMLVGASPDGVKLSRIAALVGTGRVRPIIAAEFPLDEVANALEMSRTNHTHGKIIIRVAQDP